MALLQVCFSGRIAEEIFCDDLSSGAESDIQQATKIARQMVLTWGMSEQLGLVNYGPDVGMDNVLYPMPFEKEYSEKTAEQIDREIKAITDEAYKKAKELIDADKDNLQRIAEALLKYETLDAEDVKIILEGGELDKPTVADLLVAEQARNEKSNSEENKQPGQSS